ncbi:MAG: polar amino acid transport system substrate-binding protein [Motiliproteus sp.]|jgi:polar amino acid transport system substrate-binding protein
MNASESTLGRTLVRPLGIILWLLVSYSGVSLGQTLTACGHPFYPPVSWIQKGKLQGLAPAITELLFNELGYKINLKADSNWKRCLRQIEQGKTDIVVAAYRITRRERYLHYSSQPVIADPVTLFINRDKPFSFNRLDDLHGKTAGLLLGDSFGDAFDGYLLDNNPIEYVSSGQQNFAKLALGRIDFMPLGQLSGELQSRKLGFYPQIIPLNRVISTETYYLAVGRNSDLVKHLPYINRRLQEMRQDGTLERLTEQQSQRYLTP